MKTASLTEHEKRIAKKLLGDGNTYQDVQQLINTGRTPTINPGRLAGWKDWDIEPATEVEIKRYKYEKSLVDLKSGLSPIDDERLFRAREAMVAAVEIFNSPTMLFKVQIFPVLSQISWTYLLHEYYDRRGVEITDANGNSLLLSQMLNRDDCPLESDVKKNLTAVKTLRDNVEHKILSSIGRSYWPLFQANCLNFDQTIRKLFGENSGLRDSLSIALQFSKMDVDQLSELQTYDLTPQIEAIDQLIAEAAGITGNEGANYQFKVSYHFEKATKGDSHIVFSQNNPEGKSKKNVLTQKVVGDELWPFRVKDVIARVREDGNPAFNSHHHQLAWKKFGARPRGKAKNPADCKKDFCHYHTAHQDYTYSQKWVDLLVEVASNPSEFEALKRYKPKA
ncbi:DUF3644 domain-containing protein [Erythrobacter gaetbuli]|uniref:DUF3644 domain-containing protein n=1 Tax=Qipengyuania gaetbuli TaxID=266952 RepID=A0A844Y328_9SPHN|nr:DUF3644 domain-containing protein [Qipengyuania gaetbuli]MXO52236.1 DUF3644 domain-containing protein [Qipengyuania gaetbuli]